MEARGFLRQVRNCAELDEHLAAWDKDPVSTPLGFVLTMEGADPIVAPEQVGEWWDQGLRVVSLVHYGISAYSHGTQAPGGLTQLGIPLLRALEKAGIILDLSHMAEGAFWEALEIFGGPLVATHNGCRALCDHDRQLDDDQIKALAARGGVIGTAIQHHPRNRGGPHRPHLPANRQRQARRPRHRPGRRLRQGAKPGGSANHSRSEQNPRPALGAWLWRCRNHPNNAR